MKQKQHFAARCFWGRHFNPAIQTSGKFRMLNCVSDCSRPSRVGGGLAMPL